MKLYGHCMKSVQMRNFFWSVFGHFPRSCPCSFLRIWSHLLTKSLMKNSIFCAVYSSKLSLLSMMTPKSFLERVFSILAESTFITIFSLAINKTWYLSPFPFSKLCENHLKILMLSSDLTRLLIFLADMQAWSWLICFSCITSKPIWTVIFLKFYLVSPRPILGHYRGHSFTH